VQLRACVKHVFTNTWSTGNKQEELEIKAQSQMYNLTGIAETWWNNSQDWSAATTGYMSLQRTSR